LGGGGEGGFQGSEEKKVRKICVLTNRSSVLKI
jgi:hypothetical protein